MKIIDFDAKFFEYARKWVMAHPGLNEDQVEDSYNQIMQEWITAPAAWLDGAAPADYFNRFDDPAELIALTEGYSAKQINLPEPLYARIVGIEACAPLLLEILKDEGRSESLRAEAMGMLRDMDAACADEALVQFVCTAGEQNELSDMAADILSMRGYEIASRLLDAYPTAPEYGQDLILEICCNYPGDERIYERLIHRLKNRPEERARWAASLQKLGDPRAVELMQQLLQSFDLGYLDYIELRAAVDALGGDPGPDRDFYGDPDFEALRNLE